MTSEIECPKCLEESFEEPIKLAEHIFFCRGDMLGLRVQCPICCRKTFDRTQLRKLVEHMRRPCSGTRSPRRRKCKTAQPIPSAGEIVPLGQSTKDNVAAGELNNVAETLPLSGQPTHGNHAVSRAQYAGDPAEAALPPTDVSMSDPTPAPVLNNINGGAVPLSEQPIGAVSNEAGAAVHFCTLCYLKIFTSRIGLNVHMRDTHGQALTGDTSRCAPLGQLSVNQAGRLDPRTPRTLVPPPLRTFEEIVGSPYLQYASTPFAPFDSRVLGIPSTPVSAPSVNQLTANQAAERVRQDVTPLNLPTSASIGQPSSWNPQAVSLPASTIGFQPDGQLHLCHLCPRRFTRRANLDDHLVKCEKRKSAANINQQLVSMQRQIDPDTVAHESEKECTVCFTNEKKYIVLPCTHFYSCLYCLQRHATSKCAMCRGAITGYVLRRLYQGAVIDVENGDI